MKKIVIGASAAAVVGAALLLAFAGRLGTARASTWSPKAAATYLDGREAWWAGWPRASKDHGTFCVSCHTVVPYALARPTLREAMSESDPSREERQLLEDVKKRVRMWNEVKPYYSQMGAQARGTEAVLNALVLSSYDSRSGHLSDDARAAFANLWATQQTSGDAKGRWLWIQFDNEPWEAPDSPYYGATLAAIAVGMAPGDYRSTPEIQNNVKMLGEYLNRESAKQSLMNRVYLLWASTEVPGILDEAQQKAIVDEVESKQLADGGWNTSSLIAGWKRADGTAEATGSDGCATGLVVYTLERAGISPEDARVKRGLAWLSGNQSVWGGHWNAYSLNHRHANPFAPGVRFMDDAATGYAILALMQAKSSPGESAAVTESKQLR
ncbi:MAG TPA: hypothetical protein VMH00_10680 [Candidatus Limnocylindrales bacterium]|nr:hypothetical protein [Candidatus Limnocylindrales bacterium]